MAGSKNKTKAVKGSGPSLKKKRDGAGVSIGSSTPSTATNGSPSSVSRREPPPAFVVPSPSQISPPPPRKSSSTVQKQTPSRSPGSQSSGLRPQHQLQRVFTPPPREPEPEDQLNIVEQDGEDEDEVDEEEGDEEEVDEGDEDAMDQHQPPGHQGMPLEALLNMDGRALLLQRLSPIEGQGSW